MPATFSASASKPRPRPPVYDDKFAQRAREATRQATQRKGRS